MRIPLQQQQNKKMVIQFNRGKTISKEDMAKLEASIEYTYTMASQVLPIFVQREAGAQWRSLKNWPYIPPDHEMVVCRCELDLATGRFHVADLRKGVQRAGLLNRGERIAKKSSGCTRRT